MGEQGGRERMTERSGSGGVLERAKGAFRLLAENRKKVGLGAVGLGLLARRLRGGRAKKQ